MKGLELYLEDETAWLDQTAQLLKERRLGDVDRKNLAEFLEDMAERDKREVFSRLVTLLVHLLKWDYQSGKRSRSWKNTITVQRDVLRRKLGRKTLKAYSNQVFLEAYADAVGQAAVQTGLPKRQFPATCPHTLDEILKPDDER